MEIVLISLVFIALFLFIVWRPFFKSAVNDGIHNNEKQNVRDETNVELYKEHKTEIERDFSDGAIDEENYQYLLAELDKSLLQDITAAEKMLEPSATQPSATQPSATQPSATQPSATQPSATQHSATQPTKKPQPINVLWPIALSLFIVTFSVVIYLQQGTFDKLMATPTSHVTQQGQMSVEQQEQARQEQMLGYINKLQQHVKGSPDDREAWYNLGQTYVGAGEFDFAIAAFNQVMRIEGEHADILGAIAQASYYRNNQQIDEQVQALIDKALALDNNDPATNILLGMHNFIVQNYVTAIEHWQRVIDTNRQGVNITALKEAVVEAKNRLGMSSAEQSTGQLPVGPQLQVSVSLSADIAKQLAQEEDKVVFVYAIPTDGKRMPLAALKLKASDLPKVIILSNNNAMSPQNNLSSVSKVHVYAVVSKQGGAGIKPGDFKAEVHDILVNSTDIIELVIDKLVE